MSSEDLSYWLLVPQYWSPLISAIAWPIAIVVAALLFRSHFGDLVPRIQSLGPNGVSFSDAAKKQEKSKSSVLTDQSLSPLLARERTPAIERIELNLRERFSAYEEAERYNSAVYELAIARLDNGFWLTYQSIFGSQIKFLKLLKQNGFQASSEQAEEYFKSVGNVHKEIAEKFESQSYYQFLTDQGLIEVKEKTIVLTAFGDGFLLFLHRLNLSEDRPY